jgi:Ca-activated chloride channel homolog
MPVGGTAIARALTYARNLLQRDPKSADHKRVIVLVTDGEDLEGDPVAAARGAGNDGTVVHVVQIGGRTPELIPEVGPDGKFGPPRKDRQGRPLTTELSAEGEKQLAAVAAAGEGKLVRAERGSTGIDLITAELKKQMKSELGEKVETVYADVYFYPLALAILLLVAEVFVGDAPLRVFVRRTPPPATKAQLRVRRALGRAKGTKHAAS